MIRSNCPEMPDTFAPLAGHFLAAYHEACLSTAKSPTKYVVNRVLLKGKQGQIVGTDCSQLLVQGGFTFPFTEDLLLPRCGVFGLQPFRSAEDVQIGRTDLHVVFRLGAWSFAFTIDTEGRFPDYSGILPRRGAPVMAEFHLDEEDSRVMCIRLADLLRRRDTTDPDPVVTLDLHEPIRLRFREGEMVREFPLSRSERTGKGVMLSLDLKWLLRVLHLGFRTFRIRDPEKPIVAEDGERTFMVMPAATHSVLKAPYASTSTTSVEHVNPPEPAAPVTTALAPIDRNGMPAPLTATGGDDPWISSPRPRACASRSCKPAAMPAS